MRLCCSTAGFWKTRVCIFTCRLQLRQSWHEDDEKHCLLTEASPAAKGFIGRPHWWPRSSRRSELRTATGTLNCVGKTSKVRAVGKPAWSIPKCLHGKQSHQRRLILFVSYNKLTSNHMEGLRFDCLQDDTITIENCRCPLSSPCSANASLGQDICVAHSRLHTLNPLQPNWSSEF